MIELTRAAWGQDNPSFRQVFTSRFIPGGSPEQLQWFNELCLKCTVGETAARLFEARGNIDIEELLPLVRVPTLVLHARRDEIVPISEGHLLASRIEGLSSWSWTPAITFCWSMNRPGIDSRKRYLRFCRVRSCRHPTRNSPGCPLANDKYWP